MTEKTSRPPTATVGQALSTDTESLSPRKLKENTKKFRVLKALTSRSYNRFEAARELHDPVLNSTVSSIQQTHGIRVDRLKEVVSGYQGAPARVCRYWVAASEREKALRVLGIER